MDVLLSEFNKKGKIGGDFIPQTPEIKSQITEQFQFTVVGVNCNVYCKLEVTPVVNTATNESEYQVTVTCNDYGGNVFILNLKPGAVGYEIDVHMEGLNNRSFNDIVWPNEDAVVKQGKYILSERGYSELADKFCRKFT